MCTVNGSLYSHAASREEPPQGEVSLPSSPWGGGVNFGRWGVTLQFCLGGRLLFNFSGDGGSLLNFCWDRGSLFNFTCGEGSVSNCHSSLLSEVEVHSPTLPVVDHPPSSPELGGHSLTPPPSEVRGHLLTLSEAEAEGCSPQMPSSSSRLALRYI